MIGRLRSILRQPVSLYLIAGLQSCIAVMVSRWWIINHSPHTTLWPSVVVVSLSIVTATMLISAAHGIHNCPYCPCAHQRPSQRMARELTPRQVHKRLGDLSERRARKEGR